MRKRMLRTDGEERIDDAAGVDEVECCGGSVMTVLMEIVQSWWLSLLRRDKEGGGRVQVWMPWATKATQRFGTSLCHNV